MKAQILQTNAKYGAKVDALLREFSSIPEDILNRRPPNGGWSAAQTAWHLIMVEERSLKYVQKKLSFGNSFEKVGLGVHWRSLCLNAALYLPIKFKAPASSNSDTLPETSTFSELNEYWQRGRSEWLDFLTQMPDNLTDKAVYKHPRAGRIGWLQMLSFFEQHFDRHRKQIKRALLI